MASFYYNYQNPSGFCFLMQIRAILLCSPLELQNLNLKRKTKWILVVVVKWRHHENGLLQSISAWIWIQDTEYYWIPLYGSCKSVYNFNVAWVYVWFRSHSLSNRKVLYWPIKRKHLTTKNILLSPLSLVLKKAILTALAGGGIGGRG